MMLSCQGADGAAIRTMERESIRQFVSDARGFLGGRVLDFGCGKPGTCRQPQPYRDLVAGEYVPFDVGDPMPEGTFDAVLMTQVLQYLPDPRHSLIKLWLRLNHGGALVMTGPTNWAEVEATDLSRYTRAGIVDLLRGMGFRIERERERAQLRIGDFALSLGWGVVALKH